MPGVAGANLDEIRDAIEVELEHARRPIRLEIDRIERPGPQLLRLTVRGQRALDEGLEGAKAWWPRPGQRGGGAEVLSVLAETDQVDLWQATAPPPGPGEALFLYPPLYLEALRRAWADAGWARRAVASSERGDEACPWGLEARGFARLRPGQLRAFGLVERRASFLHGPPGTGKTTTLGALVGSALVQRPASRVLLLSTTNVAVDEALLSVDRALTHLGGPREACKRVGVRYEGGRYAALPHLLPPVDRGLLRRRSELEQRRPQRDEAAAYAAWKEAMEEVQRGLRQHFLRVAREARLLAMTTTHAAFVLEALGELDRFDLVVIDEASQVSQAHALALSPLGERALYAGDPRQLSPVTQSEHPSVLRWLRTSMFQRSLDEGPSSVFLEEQSRMAKPIGTLISEVFYGGKLRVASDALASPRWSAQRALPASPPELSTALRIERVAEERGQGPRPGAGGSIERPASAQRAAALAQRLAEAGADVAAELLVLTPFRAQRALLQHELRLRGLGAVQVSTVHRAQGRERHTVLYDPVDGGSAFLQGDEARRLLNVALSRAQARLVLFLSARDLAENALLRQVATVADNPPERAPAAEPLRSLVGRPGFPQQFDGLVVEHGGRRLRLDAQACTEQHIVAVDLDSGQARKYARAALARAGV